MHSHLLASVLLMATCAQSLPVTITGGAGGSSSSSSSASSPSSPGVIVEASGTDVVAGNESNTNDPGKTIFVPSDSGATVIPTTEDPSVLTPGGIPVTITGGSDGVVVIPGGTGAGTAN